MTTSDAGGGYLAAIIAARKATEQRLASLTPEARAAYVASAGEILLPTYARFVRDEGWGDVDPLRRALDAVWAAVGGERAPVDVATLGEACDAVIPDSDDFGSRLGSAAQDAAIAVAISLDCLRGADDPEAADGGAKVVDVLDMALEPDDEARELPVPIERELERQRRVLEIAERDPSLVAAAHDAAFAEEVLAFVTARRE